ncbi:hypothetical protein [Microbulbifer pacificus]|uniref:Uncharacterized protein n=1 Tax=Microbulbifer pacificus TaxID=407164 RepID=A0AAU0MXQ1_9GAMM|nr:hypothetical protein [Microbulbifer pacificus]WOX04588.1 hypothetical protein R5R33_12655 [Microbulbifer pacificus]
MFLNRIHRYHVLLWVLLSIGFCALAAWQAERSLARDLSAQLNQSLPEKLALALQARLSDDDLSQWVAHRLDQDLQSLTPASGLPLVRHCAARVTQLVDDGGAAAWGDIRVLWHMGSEPRSTWLALDCQYNWPLLAASQSLLALLLIVAIALLPRPLSRAQRGRIAQLTERGLSPLQARSVSETLTDDQLLWFDRALQCNGGDTDQALAAAAMDHQLEFDCASQQVRVHGILVKLAKTPFFYYLWYARLRQQGDGWLLNPPVNRPDREGADSLIELMSEHGGHAKSINDLRDNGLRAKTLDQNRNKIRDELISALGEDLAAAYLFESERDMKSGRYRYRLAIAPAQAIFVTI